MAITTEIPWGDGSGAKIYLTRNASEGDQVVQVSSDANSGNARSKVVTFTSGVGNIVRQLTINQEAGTPQEQTRVVNPSSYDTANSVLHSWTGAASNAYAPTSSTSEAMARLTSGADAETKVYWQFDLSGIPAGATITEITLKAKARISAVSTNNVQSQFLVVCNGTTEVGVRQAMTTSSTIYTLNVGTGWTRETIQNLTLLEYAQRGSSNTTRAYYFALSGADLEVKYTL